MAWVFLFDGYLMKKPGTYLGCRALFFRYSVIDLILSVYLLPLLSRMARRHPVQTEKLHYIHPIHIPQRRPGCVANEVGHFCPVVVLLGKQYG